MVKHYKAQLLLLAYTVKVIIAKNVEDILYDETTHPNSVYSQISKHNNHFNHHKDLKIFFQTGSSESDLPVCSPYSVCGKLDTYGAPWMEQQCRCPSSHCSKSTHPRDGHSVIDRTKQYKICEPVKRLKRCKYFRDVTWTNIVYPDNSTQQIMHCRCPKNSVAYLVKRHTYETETGGVGYQFSFACSPQTKLKCQRKEPCRLFSVKKSTGRPDVDEVTESTLCSCPHNHRCPKHHLDVGVVPGRIYSEDAVRTYSGYCM